MIAPTHSKSLIDLCLNYKAWLFPLLGRLVLAVVILFAARIVVRMLDRLIKRQLPKPGGTAPPNG